MNALPYLILAHFLADYPLQTGKLVDFKKKSVLGLLIHSLTHLLVSALILAPFLNIREVWVAIVIIFGVHHLTDQTKITLSKLHPKWDVLLLYLLDQAVHLVTIAVLCQYYLPPLQPALSDRWASLYADQSIVLYALVLVLSTYFYDITRWTYRHNKNRKLDYVRDYRLMARNFIVVTAAFAVYWATR